MKLSSSLLKIALAIISATLPHIAYAQSVPAATQRLQLSVFVAGADTLTNLAGGKNRDLTVGANLTFPTVGLLRQSLEFRGTYPINKGNVSDQRSFLFGPKIEHSWGKLHPYVDFFIGRGKIEYNTPGFIFGNNMYISSTTVVYSPGAGLDYNITHHLGVKADVQLQRWNTPATELGTISPTVVTVGAIYSLDFNSRHHRGL